LGAEPPVRAPPPLRGAMPTVETAVEEEEDVTFESETKVELKVEDEAKDEDEEDEEEQEEKGEAAEEAAAAAPTKPKKEPLRPKKEQRPKPPLAAAKVTTATSLATKKAMNGSRSEHELFVERKRTELTMRDTACKAICKIKYGLRQPGAQEDGRPVIPEDWEKLYKPMLGSYIKFLLSRPDQFRVVEGSGPGFYTIEDVTLNKTAVAPVKGKDKGKGKGKFKGKDFKGKGKDVEDTGKGREWASLLKASGKDKGKGAKGKGKGLFKGKGAEVLEAEAPPSTKAARLLAEAAREALAADGEPAAVDDELKEEEAEAAEEAEKAEEADADAAEGEEDDEDGVELQEPPEEIDENAKDEQDDEAYLPETKEEDETEEPGLPKVFTRGSYINLLFAGGLLSSGGAKRPGEALAGDAKRAR